MLWGNRTFEGMYPRLPPRLLGNDAAQVARNVWLEEGHLDPVPELRAVAGVPQFRADVRTIYRFDANRWFEWNKDVDVVRAPIREDAQLRTIWTGDDYPRHTSLTVMAGGGFVSPGRPVSRRLGVPAPAVAPTATLGDFTDEDEDLTAETHSWVYTWVTDLLEEGPPSPPSPLRTRGFNTDGTIRPVTIANLGGAPPSGYSATHKRIYRSATGAGGATTWHLLATLPLAQASYTDSTQTAALGDELVSTTWDPPPADLEGLIALPNGVLAGFLGRDVWFSEPFQPHAWPIDYVQTIPDPVVGLGNFGTNVVVGTTGRPFLISGWHPASAAPSRMELTQPCVSKRSFSIVEQQGIVYASPEGLVLVGPSGGQVISRSLYDRKEWQALDPEILHGAYQDGSWIGFQIGPGATGRKSIALNTEQRGVVECEDNVLCVFSDPERDIIYVVDNDRRLKEWRSTPEEGEANPVLRTLTWRGKLYVGRPRTYSAAQVEASGYPLTLRLFTKRHEITLSVTSDAPFRLPDIALSPHWELEIESAHTVEQVLIGSMMEMMG